MARPKNLVVSVGSTVYSVSPKNLRTYLNAKIAGRNPALEAKALGQVVAANLEAFSAQDAEKLLANLGPETSDREDIPELPPLE